MTASRAGCSGDVGNASHLGGASGPERRQDSCTQFFHAIRRPRSDPARVTSRRSWPESALPVELGHVPLAFAPTTMTRIAATTVGFAALAGALPARHAARLEVPRALAWE